jgi:hypothetical protein
MRLAAGFALATLLGACADDDTSAITGDAGIGPDGDGVCAVPESYGDVGTISRDLSVGVRLNDSQGEAKSITYIAALNDDQDQVVVQLYRGFSVFTSRAIGPGTYEIEGDELNYASCGVCVRMFADRVLGGTRPLQDMMATRGTLVVSEVGGAFKATLMNAEFEHVNIDEMSYESRPVGDGCETAITRLSADVLLASP